MNTWYAVERFSAEHREALLAEVALERRVRAARRDAVPGPVGAHPAKRETRGLAFARVLAKRTASSVALRVAGWRRRGSSGTPPVSVEAARDPLP